MSRVSWRCLLALAAAGAGLAGCGDEGARTSGGAPPKASQRGAELFRERCAPCHPDGGNTINPKKTLHAAVLKDNGIKTPADVVRVMRRPGPGMRSFDAASLPDRDATLIAEYVLAAYR